MQFMKLRYMAKQIVTVWNKDCDNCSDSNSNNNAGGNTGSGPASNAGPEDNAGGGESNDNNPYKGPVNDPVILIDKNGNAIPVGPGQSVNTSPNGDYQQVIGADGRPTGDRLDRGGHRGQADPRAQGPHGHRPGITTPDGNPHLPINTP